jgi:hypothetical protein
MRRRFLVVLLALFFLLEISPACGQITNPNSFSGLVSNALNTPATPTNFQTPGCTGTGSNSWFYEVVAVDAAGGTTSASLSIGTSTGTCSSLNTLQYNKFDTSPVVGATMCAVWRITAPSGVPTGRIGNFVCGATFYDTNSASGSGDNTPAPTLNVTGGVSAKGNVNATSFTAGGTSAGTSVWTQGGALSGCGGPPATQPPPCIPVTNEFFLQAPNGAISTSFGWTAPGSPNMQNQLLYLGAATSETGGILASPLGFIASDSTTTHALFATTGTPPAAFRALAVADLPTGIPNGNLANASTTVNGNTCTLGAGCTVTLDQVGNLATNATNTAAAAVGWTLAGTAPGSSTGSGTSAGMLFAINGPAGGATTGTSVTAGQGAGVSIASGAGGAVGSGGSADTGGAGGDFSIATGAGGSGASGSDSSGGRGGNVTLNAGGGGASSGSGSAGSVGTIQLQQQGQAVFVASSAGQTSISSSVVTGTTTVQGGTDTNSASTLGQVVVRGANVQSGSAAGTSGSATIQGGDNLSTATTGAAAAGDLILRPGAVTATGGSATQANGKLRLEITGIKGTTYNAGNLGCITGGAGVISDCTSATNNALFVGVNQSPSGNAAIVILLGASTANSNTSQTFTSGHLVCTDNANAGKVVDAGTNTACPSGLKVGIVLITDTSTNGHLILVTR